MVRSLRRAHGRDSIPLDPVNRPEVWGGVEPTVNRVGDTYLDQLQRSGHDWRIDDLDRFADLGITAIRYPVLWEKTAPGAMEDADWSWPDARLERLRRLGIRPIVGLVHHGSGPPHTSLVDPDFPEKLAEYARAVARRYPWIDDYTPVNEPLTTARFSALYGHWYPHKQDDSSFARAIIGQCRAIVLAMQAIREVNPSARLIQTEDIGMVHSTPKLAYQAAFENERRWLTFDLLTGRLTPGSWMWKWLLESGIAPQELEWFLEHPCPPDVLGVNYYLTSERYLDWRKRRYPGERVGGNGTHKYVDVSAVRVLRKPIQGVETLMHQVWERYGLPIAITEVHNGSTREEQLRWLHEVWQHAVRARQDGVDVRAVTVWALLGSYNWASLVTRDTGEYEPGVFDVRGQEPRPTALAGMTRDLATTGVHDHPVLDVPGWWRRPDRTAPYARPTERFEHGPDVRRVLVIHGDPGLTSALIGVCGARHVPAATVEERNPSVIDARLAEGDVWAVAIAARDGGNAPHPGIRLARQRGIPFVTFDRDGLEPIRGGLVLAVDDDGPDAVRLAHAALDLLIDGERGAWRVVPSGDGSWPVVPLGDDEPRHREDAADD